MEVIHPIFFFLKWLSISSWRCPRLGVFPKPPSVKNKVLHGIHWVSPAGDTVTIKWLTFQVFIGWGLLCCPWGPHGAGTMESPPSVEHFLFHKIGSLPGFAFLPLKGGLSGKTVQFRTQYCGEMHSRKELDYRRSVFPLPACHPPASCLSCLR